MPNTLIRKSHRWLSLAFSLTVLANIIAMFVVSRDNPLSVWIGASALLPLIPLLLTGLYMFVLPYVRKRKRTLPAEM